MAAFVLAMIVNDYKNGQVSHRHTQKKACIDNLKELVLFLKILPQKDNVFTYQIGTCINFIQYIGIAFY